MRQNTKTTIIYGVVLLYIIVIAVRNFVLSHNASVFKGIAVLAGLLLFFWLLSYLLGLWSTNFRKLVDSLPSDHKLITQSTAAIDIGNFRFIYKVYGKGNNNSPFSKTYLSMAVGIPFPCGNDTVRESIKSDLQDMIDRLQRDGVLTSFNPIVQDSNDGEQSVTWTGQPFALEFLLKTVTPSLLNDLQANIVGMIDKYHLQDYCWYICNYNPLGKEYRYHKGNLLQSAVLVKHDFDKLYLNYRQLYSNWTQELETSISDEEYSELYSAASKHRGNNTLFLKDMTRRTKDMFQEKKNFTVHITNDARDGFSVNITSLSEGASTFQIIKTGSLWWLLSEGRLSNIYPISFDNESSACGFLLFIFQQLTQ